MKLIYILIILGVTALTSGCVDKTPDEKAIETTQEISKGTPSQTTDLPESAVTSTPSEVIQEPAPGEDIFGTFSDLGAMDNMSMDMDMQITLLNDI